MGLLTVWRSALPNVRWGDAWRQRHRQGRFVPRGGNNRVGPRATNWSSSDLPVTWFGSQGNVGTVAVRAEIRPWGAGGNACPSVL
jgi:hypothetical protein